MKTPILHVRFAVRKAAPGTGYGLFATAGIRGSEFVLEYKGRHIPTQDADLLKTRYLFEVSGVWTIDGSSRANSARYINHSCEPNCEATIRDGRVLIYSLRNIEKGEELTIDYGREYFKEFIEPLGCKCLRCSKPRIAFWKRK